MPDVVAAAGPWAIVVPVKRLVEAKTRIRVEPDVRMELALAMALDTVQAAMRCAAVAVVVAVTDDERALAALQDLGATVVADEPDAGLNPALVHGAAADVVPATAGIAALSSDLPALRSRDLDDALMHAARLLSADDGAAVVTDAAGVGTTLFAAGSRSTFRPAFGAGSRAAHVTAGAVDLSDGAGASLRRDVDTLEDLTAAAAIGLGRCTDEVVARHHLLAAGGPA